jgi:hypothetical protein
MLIIDPIRSPVRSACDRAMAFAAQNRVAQARRTVCRPKTSVTTQIIPPPKRIKYHPVEREALWRKRDLESQLFGLNGDYTNYGSTNGGWRDVGIGKRYCLPNGCAPRRSQRLLNKQ